MATNENPRMTGKDIYAKFAVEGLFLVFSMIVDSIAFPFFIIGVCACGLSWLSVLILESFFGVRNEN